MSRRGFGYDQFPSYPEQGASALGRHSRTGKGPRYDDIVATAMEGVASNLLGSSGDNRHAVVHAQEAHRLAKECGSALVSLYQ